MYRNKFEKLKTAKKRSNSSARWLQRQINDPYVARAKLSGYRSRSAYKLLDIQSKFHIFNSGMNVIDLGSSPGGWSQVASKLIGVDSKEHNNQLIAVDMLPMENLEGVDFIQGDFLLQETRDLISAKIPQGVDVVMSDIAGNATGNKIVDHIRILAVCENTFRFAIDSLNPGGHFITKIFSGGMQGDLLRDVKSEFKHVRHFKPDSTHKESREFYVIAMCKK